MDERMLAYLDSIEIGPSIQSRVTSLLVAFSTLCPEPIDRIFVTNSIEISTGDRVFDSLWGFSKSYLMESREFLALWNADVSPFAGSISYLGIEYENLEFPGAAERDSRLSVEMQTQGRLYNRLSAVGTNCDHLTSLLREILAPNVRPSSI